MQNNPDIDEIVNTATNIAVSLKHGYVLTEHVLLAMIKHSGFRKVLEKYGTPVDNLESELSGYLISQVSLISEREEPPRKTNALERVFNRALTQVLFTGRRTINILDLYLAIMSETNSHAHYYLLKYNVRKTEFAEFWQKHASTTTAELSVSKADEILEEHCTNLQTCSRRHA